MTHRKKLQVLFFLGCSVLALLILSLSLDRLEFSAGQPFSLGEATLPASGDLGPMGGGDLVTLILRGILAMALVFLPLYILIHLLTPEGRQRLIADLVLFVSLFVLLTFLSRLPHNPVAQTPGASPVENQPLLEITPVGPAAEFVENPPDWLLPVTSIALAILLTVIITDGYWFFQRNRHPAPVRPMERFARQADEAVEAIRAGSNFKDTEMGQVLHAGRGIQRGKSMTPQEFEHILVEKGLPKGPIRFDPLSWEAEKIWSSRRSNAGESHPIFRRTVGYKN